MVGPTHQTEESSLTQQDATINVFYKKPMFRGYAEPSKLQLLQRAKLASNVPVAKLWRTQRKRG